MKIFLPLLIIALMTSTVVTKRLHIENKENNDRAPDAKNSADGEYNQEVTGIRRVLPQLPANIFLNPNQACYQQFFAYGQPPIGLRTANLVNMRYICQEAPANPGTYFYATMFDEGRGIAVYSAYVLNANNINFQGQGASAWIQTNGIQHQGSNGIYAGQQMDRGHLFAALTSSGLPQIAPNGQNAANSARSTYQYTNAVPQSPAFNRGQWRIWEGRIRTYAVDICIPAQGTLYLITGASFVGITNASPPQAAQVPITTLPPQPLNNPAAIDKPNSMWTAALCLPAQGGQSYSFAVIGNNVQNPAAMFTQQITVAQLEAILQADIGINGLKRKMEEGVNLFPGINNFGNYNSELPKDKYPEPEEEE